MRLQAAQLVALGPGGFLKWHSGLFDAWRKDRSARSAYAMMDEDALAGSRTSDTVFVFGSGYSLHDLTPAEWEHVARHDTLGFSGFVHAKWIPVRYHLLRGWAENTLGRTGWRRHTDEFLEVMHTNPCFDRTILALQEGYYAQFCNALVGYRLLRPGTRVFRYRSSRTPGPPSRSFRDGLKHNAGTLSDAVNFAVCAGWKRIVLVGVDLYDSRYFWVAPDKTLSYDHKEGRFVEAAVTHHGARHDESHNTVRNGVVDSMAAWREDLARDGIELMVYNPRSLLCGALPLYEDAPRQRPVARSTP